MHDRQDTGAESRYFDEVAEHRSFDEFSTEQYQRVLDRMLAEAPREPRVLDAGCGSGAWLSALGARGVRAVGLELSPALAQQAREEGLEVVVGDLLAPPQIGLFDAVVLCGVLHHFPAPAERVKVLAGLTGMLAPGGTIASIDPNGSNPFVQMAFRMHAEVSPNEVCLRHEDLLMAYDEAGLQVIEVERMEILQPRAPEGPLQRVWPALRRVALSTSRLLGAAAVGNYTVVVAGTCGDGRARGGA